MRLRLAGIALTMLAGASPALAGASPALAATHYVSPTGTTANWPCLSAASPCNLLTGIEGTVSLRPATSDEVVIEAGQYPLTYPITAPVAETIHGNGLVQIHASGITKSVLVLGGASQQSELTNVQIYESGSSESSAAGSLGNTLFDDDLLVSEAPDGTAVGLGGGDLLRDSVADATATGGTAVAADVHGSGSASMRNVTAYAGGTNGTAVNAFEDGCGALDMSMRNLIVDAPGSGGITLTGGNRCIGGTVTLDIDYSDFNFAQDSLGSGISLTLGADNTSQPAILNDPSTYSFREKPNSPTVDAGTNDPSDGAFDPDGRPRFLGSAPDMGAYELPAPYPVTGTVSGISTTGATLNGTVDSEGSDLPTNYDFEYGMSTSYGSFSPSPLGTDPGETVFPDPQAVSVPLSGLQPGTTYDYRLVTDNSDGRTFGANQTFTTAAPATLTVRHGGNGEGNILVNGPTGMIAGCLDSCPVNVLTETPYTLRARPLAGSSFAGWRGGGCSGTGTCTLTLSGNTTIIPTFAINPPKLSRVSASKSKHKPKLSFTVTAGAGNLLVALNVTLPGNFKLLSSKHGVKLSVKGATATIRHGTLRLHPRGVGSVHITLTSPAIRLVKRKHPQLALTVQATESASGYQTVTKLVHKT
jgi:hypothetical protein